MSTVARPRKAKDPQRSKADILQAALEEFAARGFDGATVRDIANRIGLSHGMIRYHYQTKEQLWFAAVEFLFKRLAEKTFLEPEKLTRLRAGDMAVFRDWLRRYVHYCAMHPEHARILFQESVSPTPRLEKAIRDNLQKDHLRAVETIEALKAGGHFPADAPAVSIIYILAGACQNLFALAAEAHISLGYDPLSPEAIDAHANAVIEIFCKH